MTDEDASTRFIVVFQARDRLEEDRIIFDDTEFDEIDELRRLSEELATEPLTFLTRT